MSAPRKLPAIAATLAMIAMVTAAFFPALFGGKIIAPLDIITCLLAPWNENSQGAKPDNHFVSDAVTQYIPYRVLAERALKEDGYIGWNPYEMGGYNLAANTMATPAAWTMQLHRLLPFKDAWNLGIYFEFLIAGIGMLVFLRHRKLHWLPCLIGSVAYMFNSQFVIWIHHRWALGAFCWMPWVMWSAAGGILWRKITPRQCLLPLFIAMAFLGGSLQHMAFVFMACACLFLGSDHSTKNLRSSSDRLIFWALAFTLATAITAFSLIPQIEAYQINNDLGHIRGKIGYEHGLAQPILQSLLIPLQVWPWLVGDAQTLDGFKLIKSNYMDLAYLGTIPTILALMGCFHQKMPKQAKWLIAVGLLTPLTPLVGPLYHRVQLLFLLGGAWMAAEMLATLPSALSARFTRAITIATAAIGLVLFTATILPNTIRQPLEHKVIEKSVSAAKDSQFGQDQEWVVKRAKAWFARFSINNPRTATMYVLLICGVISLSALSRSSSTNSGKTFTILVWQTGILMCVFLELTTLFFAWCRFSPLSEFYPSHPTIEAIKDKVKENRVLLTAEKYPLGEAFAAPNTLLCYGIRSIDAYESIHYPRITSFLGTLPANKKLALSNVVASVVPASDSNAPDQHESPLGTQHKLIHISNPVSHIVAGMEDMPKVVSELTKSLGAATQISPSLRTMSRIELLVPASTRWVRIAENWHPGWKWKTQNSPWQETSKEIDSATWIKIPSQNAPQKIQLQFFPQPKPLLGIALCCLFLSVAIVLGSMVKMLLRFALLRAKK